MGYLNDVGVTYDYFESLAFQKLLKEKGINQFLKLLKQFSSYSVHDHQYEHLQDPTVTEVQSLKLLWGDEFEGHIIKLFDQDKLALIQPNTANVFQQMEQTNQEHLSFIALPEFGAWMIEVTPPKPYQCMCYNFDQVLLNMRMRVQQIQSFLPPGNHYLLVPVYPMLGVGRFSTTLENDLKFLEANQIHAHDTYLENSPTLFLQNEQQHYENPPMKAPTPLRHIDVLPIQNLMSQSVYFDDRIINPHPRYGTLAQNIRLRRGSKVEIKIPIFKDIKTSFERTEFEPNPGFITMDHMGFGMGNCALQTTYLSIDIDHARLLYDQLAVLAPLFAALTAGSPIFKGKLADWDTKWDCLEMSVDCRNQKERDPNSQNYIPKSRYSTISHYISNHKMNLPEYNDVYFPKNEAIMAYAKIKAEEMGVELDEKLLKHLGILFLRDNMVIFTDKILLDDEVVTSHFEAIQSSNWNSVRFKPPPSYQSKIGWRVEFRTMEIQLTADENAAWSIYILMIVRMFFHGINNVNFYMPMSLVDENMKRSRNMNAILTTKFYFRTNLKDFGEPIIEELYLKEILFGKEDGTFGGIQGALDDFREILIKNQCSKMEQKVIDKNMQLQHDVVNFIRDRVFGKTRTLASWMRNYITTHQSYQKDSVVTHQMNYDLISHLLKIKDGVIQDADFPKIFHI